MKIYQKEFTQWLPTSLPEAWKFFSDPRNLKRITPSGMDFSIRTENLSPDIYEGQLIEYRVSPLKGYRTSWVTRILAVEKEKYFIDLQLSGPYSLWHHEHWFSVEGNGIRMYDRLSYSIPMGWIGRMMNRILISSKIDKIFVHRKKVLEEIFK